MLLSSKEHILLDDTKLLRGKHLFIVRLVGREKLNIAENLRKAVKLKMDKLKDDKLSITMKGAMARNVVEEKKMKATMHAMSFEQQKNLQSMEYYKNKYAKRQRELQNEKYRMLNSRSSDDGSVQRKISAPACMVTVVEYKDRPDIGFITQTAHSRPQSARPRSISDPNGGACALPSLLRVENGRRSTEPTSTKNESLALPTIWPNGSSQGLQRKLSVTSLSVPTSTDLMVQTGAILQARSAPNSPCAPRREMMQSPSLRGRSKSPARTLQGMDSLNFDSVRGSLMADLNVAMANKKQFRPEQQQSSAVTADVKEQDLKTPSVNFNPKTRKISSPGTKLLSSPSIKQASNADNDTTLEENLNKIRFCRYLRSPSLPEVDERLPDELIPKAIIGGHTQWVPRD